MKCWSEIAFFHKRFLKLRYYILREMRTGFKFTGQGIFTYAFTCEQDQHLKHSSCLECSLLLLLSQYSSLSAQRWSLCSLLQMMAIGRHVEVSGGLHGGGWGGACDALSIHECCLSRARNSWERLGQPGVDLLIEPRGLWVRWLGAPGLPSEILASFEMVGLPPLAWQRPAALQPCKVFVPARPLPFL